MATSDQAMTGLLHARGGGGTGALAGLDPQHALVLELRHFTGFGIKARTEGLGILPASVKPETMAPAWLMRELGEAGGR